MSNVDATSLLLHLMCHDVDVVRKLCASGTIVVHENGAFHTSGDPVTYEELLYASKETGG